MSHPDLTPEGKRLLDILFEDYDQGEWADITGNLADVIASIPPVLLERVYQDDGRVSARLTACGRASLRWRIWPVLPEQAPMKAIP